MFQNFFSWSTKTLKTNEDEDRLQWEGRLIGAQYESESDLGMCEMLGGHIGIGGHAIPCWEKAFRGLTMPLVGQGCSRVMLCLSTFVVCCFLRYMYLCEPCVRHDNHIVLGAQAFSAWTGHGPAIGWS